MFEIKIADKDLCSHLYLSDLVKQQGLIDFTLIDGTLCRPKTLTSEQQSAFGSNVSYVQSNHSKLVIFTEGLHLHQLTQVTQALAGYLDLAFYRVIKVEGVSGFAVCAYVALKPPNNINTLIEDVANRLVLRYVWLIKPLL